MHSLVFLMSAIVVTMVWPTGAMAQSEGDGLVVSGGDDVVADPYCVGAYYGDTVDFDVCVAIAASGSGSASANEGCTEQTVGTTTCQDLTVAVSGTEDSTGQIALSGTAGTLLAI